MRRKRFMSATENTVIDLNFVPAWARRPADERRFEHFKGDKKDRFPEQRRGGARSGRHPFESGRNSRGRTAAVSAPSRRPPPAETRESTRRHYGHLPIKVNFMPGRRGLERLAARLARSGRAFPMLEVARIFLSKPDFYAVKQRLMPFATGADSRNLYQCAVCKAVFSAHARALDHVLERHSDLYYVREEKQVEAPKGNFVCVARCSLSGELLCPPNYHEFNERVRELHRVRFSSMPMEDYRRHIVNETDPSLIEQWKNEASRQVVYRTLKGEQPVVFRYRHQMAAHFLENYAPALVRKGHLFITPGALCREIEDDSVRRAVEEARSNEEQLQSKMAASLQTVFPRLGLHVFKTSGGDAFVTSVVPSPIEPSCSDAGIRRVLECLGAHPGITRQELVERIQPQTVPYAPETAAILNAIRWMVEKGHVIEFYNGTLAIPTAPSKPAK